MASNGHLPNSVLGPIAGGRLRKDAARAWNAMNNESRVRYGVTLLPTGSKSSYRIYADQVYFRNFWCNLGKCGNAAVPGTSNHGWGLAVDVQTARMRSIIDEIGSKYGWAKRWSDASHEWWHLKWRAGRYKAVNLDKYRTIKPGAVGRRARRLKHQMRKHGLLKFDKHTPVYGPLAVRAIKRMQRKHGLRADGIVGPKTWRLLLK